MVKKVIFIVDDEEIICEGLEEILDKPGYLTRSFSRAEKALAAMLETPPDLCITDIRMPGMSGLEMITQAKEKGLSLPFLLLSGSLLEVDDRKLRDLRIEEILNKPVSRKKILRAVESALGEKMEPGNSPPQKEPAPPPPSKKPKAFSVNRGTILIADDDDSIRRELEEILTGANYTVTLARDGKEALEICRDKEFTMILMDLHMPRLNGIEAVHEIKSFNPSAFIVLMTGEASNEEVAQGIEEGGYACLRKPFSAEKLKNSLEWYGKAAREFSLEKAIPHRKRGLLGKWIDSFFKEGLKRNRMEIITVGLTLLSVVLGLLLLVIIQLSGESLSSFFNSTLSQYESYAEKIIGFLERDEQRELRP